MGVNLCELQNSDTISKLSIYKFTVLVLGAPMQQKSHRQFSLCLACLCLFNWVLPEDAVAQGRIIGTVVDAEPLQLIPCRLTVRGLDDQQAYFASRIDKAGTAVVYDRKLGKTRSFQQHTTLSPHAFVIDVPRGRYQVRAQRGKEWLSAETIVTVTDKPVDFELRLKRSMKNYWNGRSRESGTTE